MVALGPGLMLLPTVKDTILQKRCYKGNALIALGIHYFKMVLTLLVEVITLQVRISIVQIGVPGLEYPVGFIISRTGWHLVLYLFNAGFYKLSEQLIGGSWL